MKILHSAQFEPAAPDPQLASLLESISLPDLRAWVAQLSISRNFMINHVSNAQVANWIAKMFQGWGYTVQQQGDSGNVVALPDSLSGDVFLVGAHFDSVPGSPGADDNASAVAAMLGCAAACALWRPLPSVIFVAFNREEEGFLGSSEFVEDFLVGSHLRLRCAHILEMVGYASSEPGSQRVPTALPIQLPDRGDFLGLLSNVNSASFMRDIMVLSRAYTSALPVSGLEVVPGVERVFPVLARSDHVPFWSGNIPAVMWTDTAEFRNPNYHQPTDTPDTLNYDFLRLVTQLLTASVVHGPQMQGHPSKK